MIVPFDAESIILFPTLTQIDGTALTGISYNTPNFSIHAFKPGDELSPISLSLSEGTEATYSPNSWVEISNGVYQFCPSDSLVIPGKSVTLRINLPDGRFLVDDINAVGMSAGVATLAKQNEILNSVADLANDPDLTFTFNIPGYAPQ